MAVTIWSLRCFVFGMTLIYATLESIKLYGWLTCSPGLGSGVMCISKDSAACFSNLSHQNEYSCGPGSRIETKVVETHINEHAHARAHTRVHTHTNIKKKTQQKSWYSTFMIISSVSLHSYALLMNNPVWRPTQQGPKAKVSEQFIWMAWKQFLLQLQLPHPWPHLNWNATGDTVLLADSTLQGIIVMQQ